MGPWDGRASVQVKHFRQAPHGLVGLGPASKGDHTPAETVDLKSLNLQAKRAALLMSRLAAEKR